MKKIVEPTTVPIPVTETLCEYIDQGGVTPGEVKLQQFRHALKIRGTPEYGSQDGKGDKALCTVKFFDPCGSWSWFAYEWDEKADICFGFVKGCEDELGDFSLAELAEVKGPLGIGIELDTHWTPKILGELR